jgi:hypothetical protein
MFDWIVMDVIDTTFEVTVVAYLMFPKRRCQKSVSRRLIRDALRVSVGISKCSQRRLT